MFATIKLFEVKHGSLAGNKILHLVICCLCIRIVYVADHLQQKIDRGRERPLHLRDV